MICTLNRNRGKIETILADDMERARLAFEAAKATFKTSMSDLPSGIPQPGSLRLEQAGSAYRHTMDAYSMALHEFNNFIIDGTVPDRLQQSE